MIGRGGYWVIASSAALQESDILPLVERKSQEHHHHISFRWSFDEELGGKRWSSSQLYSCCAVDRKLGHQESPIIIIKSTTHTISSISIGTNDSQSTLISRMILDYPERWGYWCDLNKSRASFYLLLAFWQKFQRCASNSSPLWTCNNLIAYDNRVNREDNQ